MTGINRASEMNNKYEYTTVNRQHPMIGKRTQKNMPPSVEEHGRKRGQHQPIKLMNNSKEGIPADEEQRRRRGQQPFIEYNYL